MRLKDFFLIERVIPDTKYGYWISPTCDIIPVGFCEHDNFIAEHYHMTVGEAILAGWVRIVGRPLQSWITIELQPRPSDRCKLLLAALCKDKSRITVDLVTMDGLVDGDFDQWSKAARFISDPMRMRRTTY